MPFKKTIDPNAANFVPGNRLHEGRGAGGPQLKAEGGSARVGPGRRGEPTSSYYADSQVEPADVSGRAGLQLVTVNANSHGTLMIYLTTAEADVTFAQ